MARINVYLPDELAVAAREQGLNVSRITQHAVRDALVASETDRWLVSVPRSPEAQSVTHADVMAAMNEARDELGSDR